MKKKITSTEGRNLETKIKGTEEGMGRI